MSPFTRRSFTLTRLTIGFLIIIVSVSCGEDLTVLKLDQTDSATHEAVSDAVDLLISKLEWNKDEVKIVDIDTTDAKLGQTLIYEFDIQVGETVIPLRLSEEIVTWTYIDELPKGVNDFNTALTTAYNTQSNGLQAILAPFQLSGPVELWIQDAEQMRLAVPNDVEAGVLKKVLLADGAVVTVEGAREVSLAQPLQLPLPLPGVSNDGGLAASIVSLAERLRYASLIEEKSLLSLKIVGPTSLIASTEKVSDTTTSRLKVKRLARGAVKLISPQHQGEALITSPNSVSVLKHQQEPWLWPLPSLNGSDPRLLNLEKILLAALGSSVYQKGSFKLLRAKVAAATFVRVEFQLEKKLSDEDVQSQSWPKWWTRPSVTRLQFELLAKLERQQLVPVRIKEIEPYMSVDTITWRALTRNATRSKMPSEFFRRSAMTLNPNWDGLMD